MNSIEEEIYYFLEPIVSLFTRVSNNNCIMSNKGFTQTVITEVKTLKNDVNDVSSAVGQRTKCKCQNERSKGPKRQCPRKKDFKCESTFTCIDDKLGSENGRLKTCLKCSESKTSIEGACCSSQIKCSTRTGNTCNSLSRCPSSSHCRTTSSNNSQFPESSFACDEAGQAANNVAKNANSCYTDGSDSKRRCCCTKNAGPSTCRNATQNPCRSKKYKQIWKNFKKVWSRKPKPERSFEIFCAKLFSNKAVNTCNSNISFHCEMRTQCKTNACNSKNNKAVCTERAVYDMKLCQTSDTLLNSCLEKNNDKQDDNKEPLSTNMKQQTKPKTSLFPNFSQRFSKNQKKDKSKESKNIDKQNNNNNKVINNNKSKKEIKGNENNAQHRSFTTSAQKSKAATSEASTQHKSSSALQSSKPSGSAAHNASNNVGQSKQIEIQENKVKRKVKIQNVDEKKTVLDKCQSHLIFVARKNPGRSHCNCKCSEGKYCNN